MIEWTFSVSFKTWVLIVFSSDLSKNVILKHISYFFVSTVQYWSVYCDLRPQTLFQHFCLRIGCLLVFWMNWIFLKWVLFHFPVLWHSQKTTYLLTLKQLVCSQILRNLQKCTKNAKSQKKNFAQKCYFLLSKQFLCIFGVGINEFCSQNYIFNSS